MQFKDKRKKNIQLDITPIVDMVFKLLIFFALFINCTAAASINLVLPKTSVPSPATQFPVIQINKYPDIMLDHKAVTYTELPEAVVGLYRQSADLDHYGGCNGE